MQRGLSLFLSLTLSVFLFYCIFFFTIVTVLYIWITAWNIQLLKLRTVNKYINITFFFFGVSGGVSYLCTSGCLYFHGFMCRCSRICLPACLHVNPQRHKAPMPLCSCQQPPHSPRLRLGRSWGLTFHFSDPLFHRANSYAGLEMCYVAWWDKNQGQFQNNLRPRASRLFLSFTFAAFSLRWHHLHYESDRQQGRHLHSGHSSLCRERDSVSQTQLFLTLSI